MTFNKSLKLATVSAVALGIAWYAGSVTAAPFEAGSDIETIPVNADVLNTIDVTATAVAFLNIGVTSDTVDTATMVMAPDGSITNDTAGAARMVSETGNGTAGTVTVTGAFQDTELHIDYSNPVNLTCGACVGTPPDFTLDDVLDDLDRPAIGGTAGTLAVDGIGTTGPTNGEAAGGLTWNIGATISTEADPNPYESGAYAGSFDMEIYY